MTPSPLVGEGWDGGGTINAATTHSRRAELLSMFERVQFCGQFRQQALPPTLCRYWERAWEDRD